MKMAEIYTKRLNINITSYTYDKISEKGSEDGRKAGNMARLILENWAKKQDEE